MKLSIEVDVPTLIVIGDLFHVLSQVKQSKDIQDQIVGRLHKRILSSFSHFDSLCFTMCARILVAWVMVWLIKPLKLPGEVINIMRVISNT